MKLFVNVALISFLILLDLLLGKICLPVGLCAYAAAYFYFAYGRSYGWLSAALSGIAIDAAYNRPYALSGWIFMLSLAIFVFIIYRTNQKFIFYCIAGGAMGAVIGLCNIIAPVIFASPLPGPDWFTILLFNLGFGVLNTFIMIILLDFLGDRAGLPLCLAETLSRQGRNRRTVSRSKLNTSGKA